MSVLSLAFPMGGGLALDRLDIALYVTDLDNVIMSNRKRSVLLFHASGKRSAQ